MLLGVLGAASGTRAKGAGRKPSGRLPDYDGGVLETGPGKALAAAVTISHMLPFQAAPALGTDGKRGRAGQERKYAYLHDRHRGAEGKFVCLYAQKVIGGLAEAQAHLLKNVEGRIRTLADDAGKMPGAAVAPFGCPLITEMLCVANFEKRNG